MLFAAAVNLDVDENQHTARVGFCTTAAHRSALVSLKANGKVLFEACVACHTLSETDGPRAGPTLAGLFGRKIASLPGYRFSDALTKMEIVWTPETVARLFEIGPNAYTPGTKMPEQRIGSADDRRALTDFLARVTAK